MNPKTRVCNICNQAQVIENFKRDKKMLRHNGRALYCRDCVRTKSRAYQRKSNMKLKNKILTHYGMFCVCCKEADPVVLSIDHINNDGSEHRRSLKTQNVHAGTGFYRWLVRTGFPAGFQVLCYNCNIAKHRNGGEMPEWRVK